MHVSQGPMSKQNASENVIRKMWTILFRFQCVNRVNKGLNTACEKNEIDC